MQCVSRETCMQQKRSLPSACNEQSFQTVAIVLFEYFTLEILPQLDSTHSLILTYDLATRKRRHINLILMSDISTHTQKLRTFGKSGFVIFMQKLLLCRQWHAVPNFSTENRLVWWQKKSEKLSGLCSRQHPLFIVCECDSWLAAYRSRQAFVWS